LEESEESEESIESQYSDVNEKGDALDESDESQVSKPRLKSASTHTCEKSVKTQSRIQSECDKIVECEMQSQ
jgi:hypothetical protein